MRLSSAVSAIALAVLAVAAPQPTRQGIGVAVPIAKRSVYINADQTANAETLNTQLESVKAKISLGFTNYEKNTGTKHPFSSRGLEKRGVGLEPLIYNNPLFWHGTISVGTPMETFTVVMDTGSSDLFLPGPGCSNCIGHTIWDPSASSSSKTLGKSVQIPYGAPSDLSDVIVEEYTDSVSIAGLTATNQTLGAAKSYSSMFQKNRFPADGLMGLGFQSISAFRTNPVFQTLLSEEQVTDPVFSFKLSSSGSELYIGGSNSKLYTGDFSYTPVTHQGFWQVNMDSVQANGRTILNNVASVIDTGSTLVIGTASQVSRLYSVLGGEASSSMGPGFYTFPCNSFPTISLTFGGRSFPISVLNIGRDPSNSSRCVSGLIADKSTRFWIIGDIFLLGVYTSFDVGNLRVGFANLT